MERPNKYAFLFLYIYWFILFILGSFDIVGPYFTSSGTITSKFLYSCVLETIKLFHLHSLRIMMIVCDGASSNLTMIKATHGHFGTYPILSGKNIPILIYIIPIITIENEDPYEVSPYMLNPFDPPNLIYWLICPTHQVCKISLSFYHLILA